MFFPEQDPPKSSYCLLTYTSSCFVRLHFFRMKVTRGQHIKAGGREERGSQLSWREEGSSLLAWRRQRSVLAWRRGDKESLLSWRRPGILEDGRHMCRVSSAQRGLRGAERRQEMEQPGSCYAGANTSTSQWKYSYKILLNRSSQPSWWPAWEWLLRGWCSTLCRLGQSSHRQGSLKPTFPQSSQSSKSFSTCSKTCPGFSQSSYSHH